MLSCDVERRSLAPPEAESIYEVDVDTASLTGDVACSF